MNYNRPAITARLGSVAVGHRAIIGEIHPGNQVSGGAHGSGEGVALFVEGQTDVAAGDGQVMMDRGEGVWPPALRLGGGAGHADVLANAVLRDRTELGIGPADLVVVDKRHIAALNRGPAENAGEQGGDAGGVAVAGKDDVDRIGVAAIAAAEIGREFKRRFIGGRAALSGDDKRYGNRQDESGEQ